MKKFLILLLQAFTLLPLAAQNKAVLDSVEALLGSSADGPLKTKLYLDIAWEYADNDPAKAYEAGQQAVQYAIRIHDTVGEANANSDIGVFYEYQGVYDKALEQYKKALAVWNRIGNDQGKGTALTNIANFYNHTSDYKNALAYYQQALQIHEKIDNKKAIGLTLNNMGLIFKQMGDNKSALQYYRRSLAALDPAKHQKWIANAYINIGELFNAQRQYDSAVYYNHKAAELFLLINDNKGQSLALGNLVVVYNNTGQYTPALESCRKILELQSVINDQQAIGNAYENMGEAYLHLGEKELALTCFEKALSVSIASNNRLTRKDCYNALAGLYEQKKNFPLALDMHKRYTALKDSIFNENLASQITEANVKYETARKDKELLEKDSEIAREQAAARQKAMQRNAFIGGFILLLLLGGALLRGFLLKKRSNKEIMLQKEIIQEKNKELNDSITYARRIQTAILPPDKMLREYLPESFVLFKPKDIVSGDFYWMEKAGDKVLIAAVDCTGHGVPGAMVSVVGHNCLTRAVREFGLSEPAAILDKLAVLVEETFEKSEAEVKDGMDISLCCLYQRDGNTVLEWAGAYNPLWLFRQGRLEVVSADKQPIGKFERRKPFQNHTIELKKNDLIYIFTDGYADQFGGEKGKKFKYRQLQELLEKQQQKSMSEQQEILSQSFETWKGRLEQVDDVLVMGIRV
jgi:serine phosphatase RsbU (regulator of sigma subunit)/Tfp pilus assembly protein PilF